MVGLFPQRHKLCVEGTHLQRNKVFIASVSFKDSTTEHISAVFCFCRLILALLLSTNGMGSFQDSSAASGAAGGRCALAPCLHVSHYGAIDHVGMHDRLEMPSKRAGPCEDIAGSCSVCEAH